MGHPLPRQVDFEEFRFYYLHFESKLFLRFRCSYSGVDFLLQEPKTFIFITFANIFLSKTVNKFSNKWENKIFCSAADIDYKLTGGSCDSCATVGSWNFGRKSDDVVARGDRRVASCDGGDFDSSPVSNGLPGNKI